MRKNLCITIDGQEGLFQVEKRLTLFHEHTTEKSLKETTQAIKKELGKMVKNGQVMLTTSVMGDDYMSIPHKRYIFTQWKNNLLNELDYRQYNGVDFSDKREIGFESLAALTTFIVKDITTDANTTLGELPEKDSRYAQSIR